MAIKNWTTWVVAAGLIGVGAGCAQNAPVAPSTDQQGAAAPEQVVAGDRRIMSTASFPSLAEIQSQLPARIPVAEADERLVEIDPGQIRLSDGGYAVQQVRTPRTIVKNRPSSETRQPGERAEDRVRTFSRDRDRFDRDKDRDHIDRDARDFTRRRFSRFSRDFRFFGLGSLYFPYYLSGSYYYPYSSVYSLYSPYSYLYSPFFYNYGGLYSPFTYASPLGYGAAPGTVQNAVVTMQDYAFQPPTITLMVGGTVTWQNQGRAPHTATADNGAFDTGTVQPGQSSGVVTFSQPGTYPYVCRFHPQMRGTIIVR